MQKLFFDTLVYFPQGSDFVRVEFDDDKDIDRACPFHLHIEQTVLEQAWNDQYPDDKGGFWTCYDTNRQAWSAWVINWACDNILNQDNPQLDYKERYEQLVKNNEAQQKDILTLRRRCQELERINADKDIILAANHAEIKSLEQNVYHLMSEEQRLSKELYGQVKGEEVVTVESAINIINSAQSSMGRKGNQYPRKTA